MSSAEESPVNRESSRVFPWAEFDAAKEDDMKEEAALPYDDPQSVKSRQLALKWVLLGTEAKGEKIGYLFEIAKEGAENRVAWDSLSNGYRNLVLGAITTLPEGRVGYITVGSHELKSTSAAGFAHVVYRHEEDFARFGISSESIASFILRNTQSFPTHQKISKDTGEPMSGYFFPLGHNGLPDAQPEEGYLFVALGDYTGTLTTSYPIPGPLTNSENFIVVPIDPSEFQPAPDTADAPPGSLVQISEGEEEEIRMAEKSVHARKLQEEEERYATAAELMKKKLEEMDKVAQAEAEKRLEDERLEKKATWLKEHPNNDAEEQLDGAAGEGDPENAETDEMQNIAAKRERRRAEKKEKAAANAAAKEERKRANAARHANAPKSTPAKTKEPEKKKRMTPTELQELHKRRERNMRRDRFRVWEVSYPLGKGLARRPDTEQLFTRGAGL
ncbi:hypothetical protein BJ508DRAFT_367154 [Ascobolus immersus RN42]|uniref:Uncharacterized protein n=1 Tax=Ascobolus immersus RN42 TaxID=1160509 RepID=A0A3N4HSI0_ASCIM|nr:hypothetical protein BJ508DRAFT_367154 [Ascobolus immersus RN42]